ncbi:hypothetical protein [Cupriavidus sp. H18C1]
MAAGVMSMMPMRSTMPMIPMMPTSSAATMCAEARAVVGDRGFVAQLPGI